VQIPQNGGRVCLFMLLLLLLLLLLQPQILLFIVRNYSQETYYNLWGNFWLQKGRELQIGGQILTSRYCIRKNKQNKIFFISSTYFKFIDILEKTLIIKLYYNIFKNKLFLIGLNIFIKKRINFIFSWYPSSYNH